MPTPLHAWTLRRLHTRLSRLERAKDRAMRRMIHQDASPHARLRHQFQDPGEVGDMLDEIARLRGRLANLAPAASASGGEGPSGLEAGFPMLLRELERRRQAQGGRVSLADLRKALSGVLRSDDFQEAVFQGLRDEMTRLQKAGAGGPEALRQAMARGLVEASPA